MEKNGGNKNINIPTMVGWVISSEDILKVVEDSEEVEASDDDVVKFRKGEEKCGRSLDFLLTSSCTSRSSSL